jgi:quercetin dioxygenase-like cupin family protein
MMSSNLKANNPQTPGAKRAGPGEYLFDLHKVNQIMGGPAYSPVFGGCVEGERMIVALMRYPAGQPSDAHSHPNEQWIFILEGELEMEFDGTWRKGKVGDVFYVPAGKVHKARNESEGDCVFFTCKDASHGLHGIKA